MSELSELPYVLDRITHKVTLPGVHASQLDMTKAISITAACRLLRGRGGKPVHLQVARRWANWRRGWRVKVGGVEYTLRLPTVKVGGELLTTVGWVRAFERARVRLSAVI